MLWLQPSHEADIDLFFRLQQDPQAVWMAAFVSENLQDRAAFEVRWRRILADATVAVRTIWVGKDPDAKRAAEAVGQVLCYRSEGQPEVSYWLAREHWGRGWATEALGLLLAELPERPVFARAAQDNGRSLAVLRHHGFVVVGEDVGHAVARGGPVKEFRLALTA